jgi:hypothetical protein
LQRNCRGTCSGKFPLLQTIWKNPYFGRTSPKACRSIRAYPTWIYGRLARSTLFIRAGALPTSPRPARLADGSAFRGEGRVFTDGEGWYRFASIKPGAYPWLNHHNAWRPNHIRFSFFGSGFAQRLVTQMYFPGDPLLALDRSFCRSRTRRRVTASSAHST